MTNTAHNKGRDTVAIICLDGAVSLYADTLSFISWKLRHEGVNIVRFGCAGMLDTCTSINSTGKVELTSFEKSSICGRCQIGQREVRAESAFEVNHQDGIADEEAVRYLDELKRRLASSGRVAETLDMEFASLPLCRIAFFDFSIVTKLGSDSILDARSANRFVAGVRDLIKLYQAFDRFRKKHQVAHIVYVNGNYTQNTLARYVFGRDGVICLSVEPQLTSQHVLNRVMLAPDRLSLHPEGLFHSEVDSQSLSANHLSDAQNVLKNFGARIEGSDFNAYTSLDGQAIDTEEIEHFGKFFGTYKRVNSFFLSSEDELTPHIITHDAPVVADPNPLGPYRTQLEYTSYLLKTAATHPEVGFVIRLHPRMAANKRDHFESEEHIRYKNMLAGTNVPENVLILYGDSKVSSYFVISRSDLVVISWSTIGLEALLLGVPVISAFPCYLMYPLATLTKQPTNQAEMEEALLGVVSFGVADDKKLLTWMGMAFEGQFFATAAPRGRGGILGKLYRVAYRISKITGTYRVFFWLVDFFLLSQVSLDHGCLLHERKNGEGAKEAHSGSANNLLMGYRDKYRHLLDEYGQRIRSAR